MLSSRAANHDPLRMRALLKQYLVNQRQQEGTAGAAGELLAEADAVLAAQEPGERHRCPIRTLSSILHEESIHHVDLLKIDVEGAELEVLQGIAEDDWKKIDQIVVETHGSQLLQQIMALLQERGYSLEIDQEQMLEGMEMYNIYALRTGHHPRPSDPPLPPKLLTPALVRAHLKQHLPEAMVPSAVVLLDKLPLTPNGKVDRRRLPTPEVGANRGQGEGEEYEEPRSGAERILAGIWEQVLRIERVGRRDKFFELGGDSILSIKVATRAAEAGLEVTVQQIFQQQTLAELAGVAEGGGKKEKGGKKRKKGGVQEGTGGEGKSVRARGKVPLTAIQEWFFEQELDEMEHFNQGMMLKVKTGVRGEQVRKTVKAVLDHHEAVGLRYRRGEGGKWEQWYEEEQIVGSGGGVGWEEVDVRGMKEEEQKRVMEAKAEEVQKGMNLGRGPLARGVYFEKGEGEQGRLLLVLHHLIVDGVSWRILLEDVERGLRQMELVGEVVELRESDTMQRWVEAVRGWVEGGELEREEGGYWLKLEEVDAIEMLPRDYEGGENRVESRGKLGRELSEEETKILLREGPKRLQAQMQEILLAGLAEAVGKWSGERGVLVGMEGHGREGIVEGLDATRTLGWFTSLYPVWLPMRSGAGLEGLDEQVRRVKEVMGGIPRKGIGYGLLRYLSKNKELRERLKGLPQPEILFNYFGQWDGGEGKEGGGWLVVADEGVGECQSGKQKRGHLFEITAVVVKGKLNVGWNYGRELHRRETVEGLIDRFMETLRSIAKLCRPDIEESHQARFPRARLKAEQLRAIVEKIERAHEAK
jgi:non-ribosomal peptide synthase protein (TIGR01720 family)